MTGGARRVFVVGVPRSGTTLVQSILAAVPGVASWTESHFFSRHYRCLPGAASRAILVRNPEEALRRFLAENGLEQTLEDVVSSLGDQALLGPPGWRQALLSSRVARDFVRLLDLLAERQGCAAWVEKTPAHLRFLPWLQRVLEPGSVCFVHVVRDGLATVGSLHRTSAHWERRYSLAECIERWNRDVARSLTRANEDHPTDRFLFYDDLVRSPEATARTLVEGLGWPWEEGILARRNGVSARLTAPGEEFWKARAGEAIAEDTGESVPLTPELRERVLAGLDHELLPRLRAVVARRGRNR